MWNDEHRITLQNVFNNLTSEQINWMVLRNFKGLPNSNPSKDVDLLVKRSDINSARIIIERTMKENGFTRYSFQRFQSIWCYTFFKPAEIGFISLKIDLFYSLVWRGAQTLTFDEIFVHKVKYNGFFVPSDVCDAFMLWIKPLMTGGVIKEKYVSQILKSIHEEPIEFKKMLLKTFHMRLAIKIWPLLEQGRLKETISYKRSLCLSSWVKSLLNRPLDLVFSLIQHFFIEINQS